MMVMKATTRAGHFHDCLYQFLQSAVLHVDALNEAWFDGKLNVAEGYPCDFSDEYISTIFKQSLSSEVIDGWRAAKTNEVHYFY